MPFALIPTALGACFFLVWLFIGGMIFRDGQLAARRDRESDVIGLLPGRRIDGPSRGGPVLNRLGAKRIAHAAS
jgi:hypothetical protein